MRSKGLIVKRLLRRFDLVIAVSRAMIHDFSSLLFCYLTFLRWLHRTSNICKKC